MKSKARAGEMFESIAQVLGAVRAINGCDGILIELQITV